MTWHNSVSFLKPRLLLHIPQRPLKSQKPHALSVSVTALGAPMESHGSTSSYNDNNSKKQWRAEEEIAGNAEALQALRELITFPLYYSRDAQRLGLKVTTLALPLSVFHGYL
jgi:hypothetical protein